MSVRQRPLIHVDEEACVNCHRCIAVCPAKMCNDGSGNHVNVNHDLCIGCGECIGACTHGARIGLDDADQFFADLQTGEEIVAIVAPAVAASYPGMFLRINGWLKSIGVRALFDVSFGAELTVESYLRYLRERKPQHIVAQPCPTLVSFIEIYRPELIPLLAPADSPMVHTMKMVRRFYPAYARSRFAIISPCYSKRREFDEVGIGDYNVTMRSIDAYIEQHGVDIHTYPETDFDNPPAERAVLFSTPGGLMRTVEREMPGIGEKTRKIEGHPGVFHYFAHLSRGYRDGTAPIHTLVDCLNCEMGCNGGPGTNNRGKHPDVVEAAVEERSREMKRRYATRGRVLPSLRGRNAPRKKLRKVLARYWEPGLYDRSYNDRSRTFHAAIRNPSEHELNTVYKKTHKTKPENFLNCGACGYNSCEQMAVAIVNGLNRAENCRHYMMVEVELMHSQHKEEVSRAIHEVATRSAERLQENLLVSEDLVSRTTQMSAAVTESSAAIEEMIAQIQSVTRVLTKNAESVQQLKNASDSGRSVLSTLTDTIAEIVDNSESLVEASNVIRSIAGQTNMLAMNAAIEASHAGQYGRGFSVVADEIRKLAEGSATQARSIATVLKGVKSSIEAVEKSSADTRKRFEHVGALTVTVEEQELSIKRAVDEQNTGGIQVLEALQEIRDLMSGVEEGSRNIVESSTSILSEVQSLAKMDSHAD